MPPQGTRSEEVTDGDLSALAEWSSAVALNVPAREARNERTIRPGDEGAVVERALVSRAGRLGWVGRRRYNE